MSVDTDELGRLFKKLYQSSPRLFRAPGRVNLIGEHTDYNDGFVLPMAINRHTVVAASRRSDRRVRVFSANVDESFEFDLDSAAPAPRRVWLDYVEGVARSLESRGARLSGADLALRSNVPEGAGLSSSAALEISVGLAMLEVSGQAFDRRGLALAGQQAEHEYVGAKVGIMDQFIAVFGKPGHALLIDCRSLETSAIPMNLPETAIVVCDTRVKHSLASSEYNRRRAECELGVELLSDPLPGIRALRDVTVEQFNQHEHVLPEPVRRRCRHVITENARTIEAAESLSAGDLERVGVLMRASHKSLRDDYEVSCYELDLLVEAACSIDGVAGARMTGGGFGGCTVNLVNRDSLETFASKISEQYRAAKHMLPGIYIVEAGGGASEI
ncbi:MAG TPA: galactokinase [Blastocatellia bacterium]|nr:galactokinase [Blastocatellia bacterium]